MGRTQSIKSIKYFIALVIIFGVALFAGTRSIENPGLYYDAVYPDYIGAIFAFPGVDNFYEITQCTFFPLLGNFYHGTVSAFIQFIVLKITGKATLAVFRSTNVCLFATAVYILFLLIYKISKNYVISIVTAILCASTSNIFELTRTQYYVMLCGCIFMLISFYYSWKYFIDYRAKDVAVAGIFQGLAFYGYFSFLFFVPITIFLICIVRKKEFFNDTFLYCWSILLGSIFYFWGYWDSALINIMGKSTAQMTIFLIGCLGMLLFFLSVPVVMCGESSEKFRKRFIKVIVAVCGIAVVGAGIILFVFRNIFINKLLNPMNTASELEGRNQGGIFTIFWKLLYGLISNKSGQNLIFQSEFFEINLIWTGTFCLLDVVCLVIILIALIKKNRELNKLTSDVDKFLESNNSIGNVKSGLLGINIYLIGYYLVSLVIIRKMQEQHLVIFYFLMFGAIALDMAYLWEHVNNKKGSSIILGIGVAIGLGVNIFNCFQFSHMLETVGGRGYYSTTINDFCIQAKNNPNKGNTVYVFPEWGFYSEFVYLTENSCLAVRDAEISIEKLQEYLNDGMMLDIVVGNEEGDSNIFDNLENGMFRNVTKVNFERKNIIYEYIISK